MSAEAMLPLPHRVLSREQENGDSATLVLEPVEQPLPRFQPGQFTMLCAPGVGEIAVSISGGPSGDDGRLIHTIRDVGAVSGALHSARIGSVIGARGPYGTGWEVATAAGADLVIVAGGLGLAPLRPVVLEVLRTRGDFARVVVVIGARRPAEFLYASEMAGWAARDDLEVEVTVDWPSADWEGPVGFVTEPLGRVALDPRRTVAFLCGPEPMMRFGAEVLIAKGLPPSRIQVSLERNMKCGVALCGHCQLGPLLLCRDGPVVTYDVAEPLLMIREL